MKDLSFSRELNRVMNNREMRRFSSSTILLSSTYNKLKDIKATKESFLLFLNITSFCLQTLLTSPLREKFYLQRDNFQKNSVFDEDHANKEVLRYSECSVYSPSTIVKNLQKSRQCSVKFICEK